MPSAKRKRGSEPVSPPSETSAAAGAGVDSTPAGRVCIWEDTESGGTSHELRAELHKQQQAGTLCDVILAVDGRRLQAHRTVLAAASPYLRALLTGGLEADAAQEEVTINDLDVDAFVAVFDFMYSGKLILPTGRSALRNLLHAGSMLQLNTVVEACCSYLAARLDEDNVGDIALMARHFACVALSAEVETFVCRQFDKVSAGDGFFQLPLDLLCKVLARPDVCTSNGEQTVICAVLRWVKHDLTTRKSALDQLLPVIRFSQLKGDSWAQVQAEQLLMRHALTPSIFADCMRFTTSEDKSAFASIAAFQPRGLTHLLRWHSVRRSQDAVVNGSVLTQGGKDCGYVAALMCEALPVDQKYTLEVRYSRNDVDFCNDGFGFCDESGAAKLFLTPSSEEREAFFDSTEGCVGVTFSCNDLDAMGERQVFIDGTAARAQHLHRQLFRELVPKVGEARVFQLRCDPVSGVFEVFVGNDRQFSMTLPKGKVVFGAVLCGHAQAHDESSSWALLRCRYGWP